MIKTNAMRLLSSAKIPFETREYEVDENHIDGMDVAMQIGMNPDQVFKTLVVKGEKKGIYVCCIPVNEELSLKKIAKVVGEKKVEMLPVKDLLATTGYIRGGCSPIGMKKKYPTFIHESAKSHPEIVVSAGVRGCQLVLSPEDLISFAQGRVEDLILEK